MVNQVTVYYSKARIPIIDDNKVAEKIIEHYHEMQKLLKIPPDRRNSGKPKDRITCFVNDLETTFKFWPRDVFERIDNEEDKFFLINMINERTATMLGLDQNLAVTEDKIAKRLEAENRRPEKEKQRQERQDSISSGIVISCIIYNYTFAHTKH